MTEVWKPGDRDPTGQWELKDPIEYGWQRVKELGQVAMGELVQFPVERTRPPDEPEDLIA